MSLIVRAANRFLKNIGWRIEPVAKFRVAMEYFVKEGKKIKFIQVGANDGVRYDDLYFFVTPYRWKGLVIEPLPDMYARLVCNYLDYPDVIPLNVAVHPSSKSVTLYHVNKKSFLKYPDWASGSASVNKSHLIKYGISEEDISEQTVECKSLMEIAGNYDFLDVDMLQIDVEGFDFEIIKSIDFDRLKPRLIKFEWMNLSARDKKDVTALLILNGYKVYVEQNGVDCAAWLPNRLHI